MSNLTGQLSDVDAVRRLIDSLSATRNGGTTFVPSTHQKMDAALYKKAFNLTDEECEMIRRFTLD